MSYYSRMADGQTIAYKILGILHHLAPNKEAQEVCTKLYNSCPEGYEQDKVMSLILADGYAFNDWPWEIAKLNKSKS